MTTILLGEEFGAATNGALMLGLIAEQLVAEGHDCRLALRDITQDVRRHRKHPAIQAPVWRGPPYYRVNQIGRGAAKMGGLADMLATQGMTDAAVIKSVVDAWRHCIAATKPDVAVGYAAPALSIACEAAGVPCVMVGDMHTIPPKGDGPLPRFDLLQPPVAREQDMVTAVNGVRRACGLGAITSLGELFSGDVQLVFGHPALDPFLASRGSLPLGPLEVAPAQEQHAPPPERVVAILSITQSDVEDIVFGILASQKPCSIHVRDASPAMLHYLEAEGAGAEFRDALDMVAEARVVIHQAEPELSVRCAIAGTPQLLLPAARSEARHMADRLSALGCARLIDIRRNPIQSVERAVRAACGDADLLSVCRIRATEFASAGPFPGKLAVGQAVRAAIGKAA